MMPARKTMIIDLLISATSKARKTYRKRELDDFQKCQTINGRTFITEVRCSCQSYTYKACEKRKYWKYLQNLIRKLVHILDNRCAINIIKIIIYQEIVH